MTHSPEPCHCFPWIGLQRHTDFWALAKSCRPGLDFHATCPQECEHDKHGTWNNTGRYDFPRAPGSPFSHPSSFLPENYLADFRAKWRHGMSGISDVACVKMKETLSLTPNYSSSLLFFPQKGEKKGINFLSIRMFALEVTMGRYYLVG